VDSGMRFCGSKTFVKWPYVMSADRFMRGFSVRMIDQ
jgi:hypothetical protein